MDSETVESFAKYRLNKAKETLETAEMILKEIDARLQFLIDVGLEYLTLSRSAGTLSGGETVNTNGNFRYALAT